MNRWLYVLALQLALMPTALMALIPFNLFKPYDVLIKPYRPPESCWQFFVGYEGAFHARGFMGDDDCGMTSCEETKGNVLQLWQKEQDGIAAFKGNDPESDIGIQSQFLNIDDDNGSHGIFVPCAKLEVPMNLLFGLRFRLPKNLTLGLYIPYEVAQLKNVVWREKHDGQLFEDIMTPDLIKTIERVGGMKLGGWKRHGPGDLMAQIEYYFHKPQAKEYLKNVGIELRGGLLFPTGLPENPDILLGLPFGYDGGMGLLAAARLELWFVRNLRFGIDVELLHLFGNNRCRRIKTDPAQTDLLLLTKVAAFKEPGFLQHYTLFLDKVYFLGGLSGQLAYQYSKRTEDRLFICAEGFDPFIFNNAESLQEWSAHNFIFNLNYEWCTDDRDTTIHPKLMFFVKIGFNGKRAILADTAGAVFSCAF